MIFTGPKKLLEKWANDKTFKTGKAFLNSAPNKANISSPITIIIKNKIKEKVKFIFINSFIFFWKMSLSYHHLHNPE